MLAENGWGGGDRRATVAALPDIGTKPKWAASRSGGSGTPETGHGGCPRTKCETKPFWIMTTAETHPCPQCIAPGQGRTRKRLIRLGKIAVTEKGLLDDPVAGEA